VSAAKQFYHCFGCGAHGNAIGFLMSHSGLGYIDAIKELAASVGMQVPEWQPRTPEQAARRERETDLYAVLEKAMDFYRAELKKSQRAIEYLKGRGVSGEIAARFRVGYAPDDWQGLKAAFAQYDDKSLVECGLVIEGEGKRYDRFRDRVLFPILNVRGAVIGFRRQDPRRGRAEVPELARDAAVRKGARGLRPRAGARSDPHDGPRRRRRGLHGRDFACAVRESRTASRRSAPRRRRCTFRAC
jgi:hypothetical protein